MKNQALGHLITLVEVSRKILDRSYNIKLGDKLVEAFKTEVIRAEDYITLTEDSEDSTVSVHNVHFGLMP